MHIRFFPLLTLTAHGYGPKAHQFDAPLTSGSYVGRYRLQIQIRRGWMSLEAERMQTNPETRESELIAKLARLAAGLL